MILRSILLVLAAASALAAEPDYPAGRLPETVSPRHYKLDLTILPDQDRFSGTVAIDVTVNAPSRLIWLHGQDLAVERAAVTDAAGTTLTATYEEIPGSSGVVRLSLPRELAAGPARIEIAYSGPFNRNLEGLYRSDEGGDSYAFTQMEPIFARLAFPSFDEPRFKTPFDVTLTVERQHFIAVAREVQRELEIGEARVRRHCLDLELDAAVANFSCINELRPDKARGWRYAARQDRIDRRGLVERCIQADCALEQAQLEAGLEFTTALRFQIRIADVERRNRRRSGSSGNGREQTSGCDTRWLLA